MMDAASKHQFDCVLFWKRKISREGVRRTLFYLTQLDGWKVGWRSFQEQWFDSCGPFKDAVISIMATLAEQERITISERTKAGLKRTVREGTKLGFRRRCRYEACTETACQRREPAGHCKSTKG